MRYEQSGEIVGKSAKLRDYRRITGRKNLRREKRRRGKKTKLNKDWRSKERYKRGCHFMVSKGDRVGFCHHSVPCAVTVRMSVTNVMFLYKCRLPLM